MGMLPCQSHHQCAVYSALLVYFHICVFVLSLSALTNHDMKMYFTGW